VNYQTAVTVLVLTILAAGSWWWADHQRREGDPGKGQAHRPVLFLENFTATAMNELGARKHRITASRMVHYDDDDSTELTAPHLTIFDPDGQPPWEVRSHSGWLSGDGKLVLLKGDVQIDREGSADLRPLSIRTESLRVRPDDDYAETDQPVTIVSRSDRIDSVGMQAWFAEPIRLKFLSNVRGRYEVK